MITAGLVLAWLSGFGLATVLYHKNITRWARILNATVCIAGFIGAVVWR